MGLLFHFLIFIIFLLIIYAFSIALKTILIILGVILVIAFLIVLWTGLIATIKSDQKDKEILAIKVYKSGVDLNNVNDIENAKRIEILKRMCNIKDINKLKKLYKYGEKCLIKQRKTFEKNTVNEKQKIIEEQKNELKQIRHNQYNQFIEEKQQAMLNYNQKYNVDFYKNKYINTNIKEICELIKICNIRMKMLKSNNIKIEFYLEYLRQPKVLDRKAIMDGSFKITITNKKGKDIAKGYCVTNKESNENIVGLNEGKYEIVCIVKDYNSIDKNDKYKVEIEPIKLWMIESNDEDNNNISKINIINNPKLKNTKNEYELHSIFEDLDNVKLEITKELKKDNEVQETEYEIDEEKFYCERCFKEISEEEYELNDYMCEDCYSDVFDENQQY